MFGEHSLMCAFGKVTQWVYAYLKVNGDTAVAAAAHLGHQGLMGHISFSVFSGAFISVISGGQI